jgi:DNA-binding MarR family transcriptional regulator
MDGTNRGRLNNPEIWEKLSRKLHPKFGFGVLVHEISRLRRKAIDRALRPLGLTGGQWWVVTYVSLHQGLSQVAIAEDLNMGKVALGGLIDRLEKGGFVKRRADSADRRMKRIFLSKAGLGLIKNIKRASESMQDKALDGITPQEFKHAIAALRKMEANLRAILKKP